MNQPIIFIGGDKGGVGKSMTTVAVTDWHLRHDPPLPVTLIESDTSNPDVAKIFSGVEGVHPVPADLDAEEGWIRAVDAIAAHPDCVAIINSAARNRDGRRQYGHLLVTAAAELQRKFVTLWPVNRQRDSLELLADYRSTMPGRIIVLRNLYFGRAGKFTLYNTSKIRTAIESGGGATLDFPEMYDEIADTVMVQRITVDALMRGPQLGTRMSLHMWRCQVDDLMWSVLHPGEPMPVPPPPVLGVPV